MGRAVGRPARRSQSGRCALLRSRATARVPHTTHVWPLHALAARNANPQGRGRDLVQYGTPLCPRILRHKGMRMWETVLP